MKDKTLLKYIISFVFEPNEYLKNDKIDVKLTFEVTNDGIDLPKIDVISNIEWIKDPRYVSMTKTSKSNNQSNHKNTVTQKKTKSFFDIFYSPSLPADFDPETSDELTDDFIALHSNFKILLELITAVVPSALGYFDESLIDDDDEDEDDFGAFGDEDEDDSEGDDEDDDSDDDEKEKQEKPKSGDKSKLDAPPVPQECPQQ